MPHTPAGCTACFLLCWRADVHCALCLDVQTHPGLSTARVHAFVDIANLGFSWPRDTHFFAGLERGFRASWCSVVKWCVVSLGSQMSQVSGQSPEKRQIVVLVLPIPKLQNPCCCRRKSHHTLPLQLSCMNAAPGAEIRARPAAQGLLSPPAHRAPWPAPPHDSQDTPGDGPAGLPAYRPGSCHRRIRKKTL